MLKKIFSLLPRNKKSKKRLKSFFDYSAKEKKKIIKTAARRANDKQRELINLYNANFSCN